LGLILVPEQQLLQWLHLQHPHSAWVLSSLRLLLTASGLSCCDVCCSLNGNRCNSSSVLKVLLDPLLPINRSLPLVLEAIFGGPPRFGVPQLKVCAWACSLREGCVLNLCLQTYADKLTARFFGLSSQGEISHEKCRG
jgi:hypothetical protein